MPQAPIPNEQLKLSQRLSEKWNQLREKRKCKCGNATRYIILTLVTLMFSLLISNTLTLNFTIICDMNMDDDGDNHHYHLLSSNRSMNNRTSLIYIDSMLSYDKWEQFWLNSMLAIGALIGIYPTEALIDRYGVRLAFFVFGLLSAATTLAMPFAADFSFYLLLFVRCTQGIALALSLPAAKSIIVNWAPLDEHRTFISLLHCYYQIGAMLTMTVSGGLCESEYYGWQSVYYLHAGLTIACSIVLLLFYRNRAFAHPNVGLKELRVIECGKDERHATIDSSISKKPVPYMAIFRSPSIWAIWLCALGNFCGFNLLLLYGPTYLHNVLQLNVTSSGGVSAVAYLLSILIKLLLGSLDFVKRLVIDERQRTQMMAALSMGSMGVLFLVLSLIPSNQYRSWAILCYSSAISVIGLNEVGFSKSAELIARHHNHVVMCGVYVLNCATMLLVPLIVAVMTAGDEHRLDDWSRTFVVHAIIVISTTVFYCVFCDAVAAEWAKDDLDQEEDDADSRHNRISSIS